MSRASFLVVKKSIKFIGATANENASKADPHFTGVILKLDIREYNEKSLQLTRGVNASEVSFIHNYA